MSETTQARKLTKRERESRAILAAIIWASNPKISDTERREALKQ